MKNKKQEQISQTLNNAQPDEIHRLELALIHPSPNEAQKRRRSSFIESELDELGLSIERDGLRQPILVRPKAGGFQIVFGERRFLASVRRKLSTIKCFVEDLTDAEVLKYQYTENHGRVEPSPVGDALIFKNLIENENYTTSQLADELGTSAANITEKLKLNDLILAAVRLLEDKKLPYRHSLYLATFPREAQETIIEENLAFEYQQIEYNAVAYHVFKQEIAERIVRNLSDAPFDTEDQRLHMTGLPCSKCTERTGYKPALFAEISKVDSCLNSECFRFKTNVHLRLQRDAIAEKLPNPENLSVEEQVKKVPLVTERKYVDQTPFSEKVKTNVEILEKPECKYSKLSLAVEGTRKGQQVYVCSEKSCEVHNPPPAPEVADIAVRDEEAILRKRAETERKVSHEARLKTFEKAIAYFDDYTVFWQFDDLPRDLIVSFLETIQYTADDILRLIGHWKNAPARFRSRAEIEAFTATLDKRQISQILFLLAYKSEFYTRTDGDESVIEKISRDYTKTDFQSLKQQTRRELDDNGADEFAAVELVIEG